MKMKAKQIAVITLAWFCLAAVLILAYRTLNPRPDSDPPPADATNFTARVSEIRVWQPGDPMGVAAPAIMRTVDGVTTYQIGYTADCPGYINYIEDSLRFDYITTKDGRDLLAEHRKGHPVYNRNLLYSLGTQQTFFALGLFSDAPDAQQFLPAVRGSFNVRTGTGLKTERVKFDIHTARERKIGPFALTLKETGEPINDRKVVVTGEVAKISSIAVKTGRGWATTHYAEWRDATFYEKDFDLRGKTRCTVKINYWTDTAEKTIHFENDHIALDETDLLLKAR